MAFDSLRKQGGGGQREIDDARHRACSLTRASIPCHRLGEAPVGLTIAGAGGTHRRTLAVAAAVQSIIAPLGQDSRAWPSRCGDGVRDVFAAGVKASHE